MRKQFALFSILMVIAVLLSFPLTAPAPASAAWKPSYTTQVGCAAETEPGGLAVTEAVATITNPEKLKAFGLKAQKGDQLQIKLIGDNRFKLLNIRTKQSVIVASIKNKLKPIKE